MEIVRQKRNDPAVLGDFVIFDKAAAERYMVERFGGTEEISVGGLALMI